MQNIPFTKIYSRGIRTLLLVGLFFMTSCTPQWLFQNKENGEKYYMQLGKERGSSFEHIIRPDDKINLSIWGHDDLGVGSSFSVFSSTLEQGKYVVVDNRGELSLPLIGTIKLEGLSEREANLYLKSLYGKYLKDPIVYLRVLNHSFTIMGEVKSPGNYAINRQRKNIIEAIGDASGFTDYADKGAIKILRDLPDGSVKEIEIDLTDIETLYNKSLIVQSNDIIYIPERRGKKFDQIGGRIMPLISVLGGVAVLVSLIGSK